VDGSSECFARAAFGDTGDSPYLLPFPIGRRYQVTQSYCIELGGHRNQLAYDFAMPIGADVLAMRAGKVIGVKEDSPDDGWADGAHNYIFILHADGSVAFYAHLRQDGVLVEFGDRVEAGDQIAESGNSGRTAGAHLHVQVFRRWPPHDGEDLPITFANLSGPLDPLGGLRTGGIYEAVATG
jgi:murein DD-endopeptidase MepM/ murein hydrolase activator NlpD